MNFTEFAEAGVGVLADFSRDTAMAAGLSTTRTRDLARVHAAFYGPTQYTRNQQDALTAAAGMPLDQLILIEKKLTAVDTAAERWRIRCDLVRHRGSYRTLSKRITRLINLPVTPAPPACRFTRSKAGMRTMILTYNERDLADLEHTLRGTINPNQPAAAQMADALFDLLRQGDSLPRAKLRPIVLVPVKDHVRIHAGHGDEVTLTLTDGTTITGAQYLQQEFGDVLEVAAFHPQHGPVNLYRAKRFANTKQKTMSKLMCPACAFPDCKHSAETTQTHHIRAWRHGGMTNMDNLAELCPFHNGVNDDNREGRFGHIDAPGGRIRWVAPNGVAVPMDTPGAMELLFD
ncbi:HNH endonuclease signature motif containing protein [Corynebacterium ureicelerivorans]|uniref:HNH endonuclease signature motif containing protein n=1 Tax=Corynebacterium ureicelerivorans TaxID=401472 RepID=UPI00264D254A|nr:HNH endonuclease signature motif containing protein [Corynebacterium ureicelerivorans]MDN8605154.1 HNH endonuclease signature motif containing protein [Corynebacterium ureicelerivorans]